MEGGVKLFVATKAFVSFNGKVLVLRESSKYQDGTNANKYDIVGGRVEPGQRFDESLLREVQEETGLTVSIGKPFFVNEWRPIVKGEQWQIVGIFFSCSAESDKVTLSADHDDFKWIEPGEYNRLNLIENLKPAFEAYLDFRHSSRTTL
jgi:8-oxo-dGTP diphosphatase